MEPRPVTACRGSQAGTAQRYAPRIQRSAASYALDSARKTEAKAKALLRKAYAAADPAAIVIDAQPAAPVIEHRELNLERLDVSVSH
jgi:hypothetical protein